MVDMRRYRMFSVVLAGLALTGCVAAVPVQTTLTVIPGQGKTEADLRADDASCRAAPGRTGTTAPATSVTSEQYYACMASRGEAVIEQQTQAYPTYAAYSGYALPAYPAYAYGYPYGYGYAPYGVGYPYYGGYFGPYVGFGIGFGYGGFYGRGFRGGYGGGFHGGGFHR